jgi:hypothetical protein
MERAVARMRRHWPEAIATYIAAFLFFYRVGTHGLPQKLWEQLAWATLALTCLGFRNPRRLLRGMTDWGAFAALAVLYAVGMSRADELSDTVHYTAIAADHAMLGANAGIWLQEHLWDGTLGLLDYASFFVYVSHFWAVIVVAAFMWKRGQFWTFARPWCILTGAGAITYIAFPAAPPWYAGHVGAMPHIDRITTIVSYQLAGVRPAGPWDGIADGQYMGNPFGAVPSLHFAYPLLIAAVLWSSRRLRPLLVAYPLAMGFSLVYLGEHFVFDLVVGAAYAGAVVWIERGLRRRRADETEVRQLGPDTAEEQQSGRVPHPEVWPPVGANPAVLRQPSG